MHAFYDVIHEMRLYAVNHHVPIIGDKSAELLKKVVIAKQPFFVLEIGAAIGYSALLMAAAAPQSSILTIEQDAARAAAARQFIERSGLQARITVIEGDAGLVLPTINGPFDLAFIDAAKGQYLDYLMKILDKLAPGAVIVADNVLFRGMVGSNDVPRRYRTIVKRLNQYLEFVTEDPRFDTVVHSTGDGVAISYYKGDDYAQ